MFDGAPGKFPTLQWHGDSFDLPDGATLLASSPAYPNQAFRFERSYGLQFHLEVTPRARGPVGRGAGLRREPRKDQGRRRPRSPGRRGERARGLDDAARARPVRALARARGPCAGAGHWVKDRYGSQHQALVRPDREGDRRASRPRDLRSAERLSRQGPDRRRVAARGSRARPAGVVGRAGQGARLVRGVGRGPRRVRGALLQVVHGREAERFAQLPRSSRGGGPRRPRGLPLARRGGRGARRDLRRAARPDPAPGQRAQGARHRGRRRGRDLPAHDPRGGGGDAGLRAHRRRPQRGVRRLLAGLGQGPDGVLRGQGADHGRSGAPQGQGRRHQARGGRLPR